MAVVTQFSASESIAVAPHGTTHGAVAIDGGLGAHQQGALLVGLHQKHPQPRGIAVLIREQAAGMQVNQRFDAFRAGTADADGENRLHFSGSPKE